MTFCDAHFHLVQCGAVADSSKMENCTGFRCCTCAHDPEEFAAQKKMTEDASDTVIASFGIHPQNPDVSFIPFLEHVAETKQIGAIGETGFDLFTEEYASRIHDQETVWSAQVEIAARFGLPLVVHCRKALDKIFRDSKKLKLIPAVVFHSFMGSPADAESIMNRGVNGFFSFGKPLLNGKKSAAKCVAELPFDRLLLETDAPFQTLKDEEKTRPEEIVRVYEKAACIRNCSMENLAEQVELNFNSVFCGNR